jgi:hypothetical protein
MKNVILMKSHFLMPRKKYELPLPFVQILRHFRWLVFRAVDVKSASCLRLFCLLKTNWLDPENVTNNLLTILYKIWNFDHSINNHIFNNNFFPSFFCIEELKAWINSGQFFNSGYLTKLKQSLVIKDIPSRGIKSNLNKV